MKIFKKIFKPWVVVSLVVVLAVGGFLIYRRAKSDGNATTYKTATASKGTITATVSGTGNLVVANSANVNSSVSGEVKSVAVKTGDTVTAGQTLFTVTNDDLDIDVSKAYASLLQAQQSLIDAQNQLTSDQNARTALDSDERATDDDKTAADQKIAKDNVSIEVANVNLSSAKSSYNTAKKTAAKRTVTASIAGTVTAVNVAVGDTLGSSGSNGSSSSSAGTATATGSSSSSSSSANIVITDYGTIKASISLNEVDAASVSAGQVVSMTFDAIDDLTLTGKIEMLSGEGTESSGVVTYPATVSFDLLDSRLKPQMSVSATITTQVKQDILYVPNSAIKSSDSESYVLLMKDGSPVKTTVLVGIANDSYTEITSGLSEGDTIVTQTITSSTSSSSSSSSRKNNSNSSGLNITGGGQGGMPSGGMGGPGM